MGETARRILLRGAVQGCGVRPALARLAASRAWSGSVGNTPDGVELIIRGRLPDDDALQAVVAGTLPIPAGMEQIRIESFRDRVRDGFRIVDSMTSGAVTTRIPRDRAVCRECLREARDPGNRRYRYPFITCAECGPRYSILHAMPFDRERTAMRDFPMCGECRREFADPRDRRFHAQTTSCSQCGPRLWISDGRQVVQESSRTAWEIAADGLREGKIVALRGIGGYQLLVDAASSDAVNRLRNRKRRMSKPFAILCRNLREARQLAFLGDEEAEQLESAANPIVLLQQRFPTVLAANVNPGLNQIGLMLPTTALHDLLLAAVGHPLVCTSGNRECNPLAFEIEGAEEALVGIADLFLHHNRDIPHPIDDSVVRVIARHPVTFRAARGIAPYPLELPEVHAGSAEFRPDLACGGHQKSALAWNSGGSSVLGPHLGDLETLASRDRWEDQTEGLLQLLSNCDSTTASPVCDPHPGYFPTQWAVARSQPPQFVWHHHAHIVTGMLEHGWLDREVLGVAWDGTGLGPDGTIWGGEFLRSTATDFVRIAHLRPFLLTGGEAAISDLRRTALAVVSQLNGLSSTEIAGMLRLSEQEIGRLTAAMTPAFSPTTTSCGRLFDAAACLILNQTRTDYEGHAAMCLESACDFSATGTYNFLVDHQSPAHIDWRPAFQAILSDRSATVPYGVMAMKFHRGLAQAILHVVQRFPELPVVFGGGVFQNRVLVELIADNWPAERELPGLPGELPPNDGGLAAGQLASAVMSAPCQERADVSGSSRSPGCLDQPRLVVGHGRH